MGTAKATRRRRRGFVAFALSLVILADGPAAVAQTETSTDANGLQKLTIRKIDSTDPTAVKLSLKRRNEKT